MKDEDDEAEESEISVTFRSTDIQGPFLQHEDLKRAGLSVELFPGESGFDLIAIGKAASTVSVAVELGGGHTVNADVLTQSNDLAEFRSRFPLGPHNSLRITFRDSPEEPAAPTTPPKDVIDAIEQASRLSRVCAALKATQRSSIRLHASLLPDGESIPVGSSKLGGNPDLPPGMQWPVSKLTLPDWIAPGAVKAGFSNETIADDAIIALPFIAQLRLHELKPFDRENLLPDDGLLLFFYNTVAYYGGSSPLDWGTPANWRIEYVDEKSCAELRPAQLPRPIPQEAQYKSCKLRFASEPTLPHVETLWIGDESNSDGIVVLREPEWGIYCDLMYEMRSNKNIHQMLGHSDDVQPYALEGGYHDVQSTFFPDTRDTAYELKHSRLLLQVDEELNGMRFGRGGRLFFFIREKDLLAKDFSKVWAIEQ
jgi:uncharacterized protein YwqG